MIFFLKLKLMRAMWLDSIHIHNAILFTHSLFFLVDWTIKVLDASRSDLISSNLMTKLMMPTQWLHMAKGIPVNFHPHIYSWISMLWIVSFILAFLIFEQRILLFFSFFVEFIFILSFLLYLLFIVKKVAWTKMVRSLDSTDARGEIKSQVLKHLQHSCKTEMHNRIVFQKKKQQHLQKIEFIKKRNESKRKFTFS